VNLHIITTKLSSQQEQCLMKKGGGLELEKASLENHLSDVELSDSRRKTLQTGK
jgi:hypothetical protein